MKKTQSTIEAYNRSGEAYADKFMAYEPYARQVQAFADLLSDGFRILDLGCGPGNVARQIAAEKSVHITGIDLSDSMIKLARANVPKGNFFTEDIRHVKFAAEKFDAIVLSFCIVHLHKQEAYDLINRAIGWLCSGGLLYISFMEGKPAGFETTSFSKEPIYFNYYESETIQDLLITNGIKLLRVVNQDYPELDGTITTDVFIFGSKSD